MRKSAIIGLITIALCVGFLVSLSADTNTYSTFTEASKDPREFHVMGYWEKEKGMQDIKEMVNPPRKQGTPGMKNQMLLTIRKMNIVLYRPSPLPLLRTLWELG